MRRGGPVLVAALVVTGALALGCSGEEPGRPGSAKVDVDTADLQAMKREAGVADCETGTGEQVDGGLPEVTLPCLGGGPDVDLASLRGPMVVNLWASWCGPCRQEMPILQGFHEQYGDQVSVLGVDWQDPQVESAMELVVDSGVTYPLLADPDGSLSSIDGMPVRGLPGLVLVDADGDVAFRSLREIESEQELVDLVDEHLGTDL